VVIEYLNSNHFQYQYIGKPNKTTLKSNAPQTGFFCEYVVFQYVYRDLYMREETEISVFFPLIFSKSSLTL